MDKVRATATTFLSVFLLFQPLQAENTTVKLIKDIPYANSDNPRQTLDLAIPKDRQESIVPLVVWIHGGAWKSGDKTSGHRPERLPEVVKSGRFAGASIAYRLSGEAKWPAQIHDCKAAIRWLKANSKKYGFDPDRIAVWGSSAGGHLVSMLGSTGDLKELEGKIGLHMNKTSRVHAVVNYFGPSALLKMDDFPSRIVHNAPQSPESQLIGGAIQKKKKKATQASPVHHVSPDDAPHLHFHGTKDLLVPYNQSVLYHSALKGKGVSTILITLEGGGHSMPTSFTRRFVIPFLDHSLYGKEKPFKDQKITLN